MIDLEQARNAYRSGLRRSEASRAVNRAHRFGWQPTAKDQLHVDGMSAVSEWLVAEHLGRTWLSNVDVTIPDRPDDGDVEGGISVRWTPLPDGSLIVHEDEPDHLRSVLVVNRTWPLRIAGWIGCGAAKQPRWWRRNVRYPAFFVPQSALAQIRTLGPLTARDIRW